MSCSTCIFWIFLLCLNIGRRSNSEAVHKPRLLNAGVFVLDFSLPFPSHGFGKIVTLSRKKERKNQGKIPVGWGESGRSKETGRGDHTAISKKKI